MAEKILLRSFSKPFRQAHRTQYKTHQLTGDSLNNAVHLGVIAPPNLNVSRLSKDGTALRKLANQGKAQTLAIFKTTA